MAGPNSSINSTTRKKSAKIRSIANVVERGWETVLQSFLRRQESRAPTLFGKEIAHLHTGVRKGNEGVRSIALLERASDDTNDPKAFVIKGDCQGFAIALLRAIKVQIGIYPGMNMSLFRRSF